MPEDRGTAAPSGLFVGLTTLDVVHRVGSPPGVNEKITATEQFVSAGGPAANAAVTFAALGGDATLLTALGSDAVADLVSADLTRHGVTVVNVGTLAPTPSAISSVLIVEATGERSVVSVDGSTTVANVPDDLASHLDGVDVVLIDGHHPLLAVAASKAAHSAGIRVVVDAGRWKPVMADIIDIGAEMVCSGDFLVPGTGTYQDSAASLVASGIATVVITRGDLPIQWWAHGDSGSVDVPPTVAADTLGAGDVFHGAYTYYSVREKARGSSSHPDPSHIRHSIERQLKSSARVAALKCSVLGPRAWIAHLADLNHAE